MARRKCDDECEGIKMGAGGDKYKSCDPKYYGAGVNNCGNGIKGLEAILEKIKKENTDED